MHISWEFMETFLAVADESSFSAAALRLGVTQPTVSRRISTLEQKLGRALFERDAEGARLSDHGARLLPAATAMARYADEFTTLAERCDDRVRGRVTIAAPPLETSLFLVPFAQALRKRHPALELHLVQDWNEAQVLRGAIPLCITKHAPSDRALLVRCRLRVENALFVAPCDNSKQSLEELGLIGMPPSRVHAASSPSSLGDKALVFASEDPCVQLQALTMGMGAMVLPSLFYGRPHLERLQGTSDFGHSEFFLVTSEAALSLSASREVASALHAALLAVEGAEQLSF